MANVPSVISGKEQLILLPISSQVFTLTTVPPGQVKMDTGIHAIVASGYIGIDPDRNGELGLWVNTDDDKVVYNWEVSQAIGPVWRRIRQVSASVSPSGIQSHDADEVDHSRWVVAGCTWDQVEVADGKKIRLNVKLEIQGDANAWISLAYQVVATGDLRHMPTPAEISANLT